MTPGSLPVPFIDHPWWWNISVAAWNFMMFESNDVWKPLRKEMKENRAEQIEAGNNIEVVRNKSKQQVLSSHRVWSCLLSDLFFPSWMNSWNISIAMNWLYVFLYLFNLMTCIRNRSRELCLNSSHKSSREEEEEERLARKSRHGCGSTVAWKIAG